MIKSCLGICVVLSLAVSRVTLAQPAPAPAPAPPDAVSPVPVEPAPVAPSGAPEPIAPVPNAPPAEQAPSPAPQAVAPAPPAAPPATSSAPSIAAPAEPKTEERARLDYSDGTFYLRSLNDNLVFVPGARAHIDTYAFGGPGVADYSRENGTGLKTHMFFRRFVIEMGGLVRKKWFYWIGGNFAPTQVDEQQESKSTANVYDGFIGFMPTPQLRIYVGQYNAPFTMENVTSSRWLDLMERALTVRTLATPYNKADGVLVWGETEHKTFEYQVGAFAGDGMNRPNIDNRVDGMARLVVRPLATRKDALKNLHIGAGGRYGSRDHDFVEYHAPNLSTPGGYAFWSASYTAENDGTRVHVIPSGTQAAASGEFYVPFEEFDVRGELVYINENRREAPDTDRSTTLRAGKLWGVGAYGQVSLWLAGTPRINGNPASTYGVLKVPNDIGKQADYAVQLVLRGELVRMNYDANSRKGSEGDLSADTDNIDVNAYQVALNYWATKHIRLTGEYSLYHFPGDTSSNQAKAPGVKANPTKYADADLLHEFSVRVGLAL